MNWEDTVMSGRELLGMMGKSTSGYVRLLTVAEAQAEISFKAGEQESDRKWRPILKGSVAMARLAGIKEVVEFVTGYLNPQFWSKDTNEPYYTIKMSVWRAKLKEWEVNDEPKT